MAPNALIQGFQQRLVDSGLSYAAQRAYVNALLEISSHLLVAASFADPVVRRELESMPDGLVVGFSVLNDATSMRLRCRGGHLERMPKTHPADVDIIFKHIAHAFAVLSFRETTPQSFANQRFVTQGDAALSMRFTRCLNRMQLVTLPPVVVKRAFSKIPELPLSERLSVSAKLYAHFARGFVPGSRA